MKKRILFIGIFLGAAALFATSTLGMVSVWFFDWIRGYEREYIVFQDDSIEVAFVQKAHGDFYFSTFRTMQSNGRIAEYYVDGDDHRWFNVSVRTDGTNHIVSGDNYWDGPLVELGYDSETKELYEGPERKLLNDRAM